MSLRKSLSLLLICIMLAAMLPVQAFADLSSSRTARFKEGGILYDAYGRTYHYDRQYYIQVYQYNSDGSKRKIILDNENTLPKRSFLITQGGTSYRGYCIEHGVYNNESLNMKALSDEGNISFYKGLSISQQKNIQLALLYGWQQGKNIYDAKDTLFTQSKWYKKTCGKYNRDDWYLATQMLIWEIQQGYRKSDMDYNYKNASGRRVHKELLYLSGNPVSIYHYSNFLKGQGAYDIYRFMADAIKAHDSIASGLKSKSKSNPKKITLLHERDETGQPTKVWSTIITDNGKYPVSKNDLKNEYRKITIVNGKDKNKLEIKPMKTDKGAMKYKIVWKGRDETERPPENAVFTIERTFSTDDDKVKNNLLFWHWNSGSGGWPNHCQTIVTGSCNPQYFYISLIGDELPPPVTTKTPEPEYFPEFEFPVGKEDLNPGWDGDTHTGMGDASLGATYVLYRDGEEIDTITLDENGDTETFTDKPWEDISDLTETRSGSREHYVKEGDPPKDVLHCTVTPTHIEWTASVTYEIREIRPDGRFIEPDSGVRTYRINYRAETDDLRECTSEESSWTDISYTVTSGIGSESSTTGTIDEVDDEITFDEQVFINDCYRGKITLTKSLEDENIFDDKPTAGGKSKSTKSMWKLYLKNGYESTRYIRFKKEADLADGTAVYRATRDTGGSDNETEEMKIGLNGSMLILDVPYDEYYMEETTADDTSFVREKFTVVVDEHSGAYSADGKYDNRYDYDIRDKKKENRIQIVKTDAETGKSVTFKSGTKFRIRYMGNKLLSDATLSEGYGRLLPNAASINDKTGNNDEFECDENGYIVIPYMLKFGIYRVEEFAVPEGYYIGEEDSPVRYYTFEVSQQNVHEDGNFGQMVDSDDNIYKADPSYKSSDWPYEMFYQAVKLSNEQAKGIITIDKEGEIFTGWKSVISSGRKLMQPVYEGVRKLAGAVFGIFAAEDELLADGNEGAEIYDANTDEKLQIPVIKSTHESSSIENVKSINDKIYSADVYETGSLEHSSGSRLWYMIERQSSESNMKRTVYITPEQKDTEYSYIYEKEDKRFTYRYDVCAKLKSQAGGADTTNLQITKTTISKSGGEAGIGITLPEQYVAGNLIPNDSWGNPETSFLDFSHRSFVYEADGTEGVDWNGNTVNFSEGASERAMDEFGKYIITEHKDENTGEISYTVLLKNGNSIECDKDGNFQTALVEIYDISYTNQRDNKESFLFTWDGFELMMQSTADNSITEITSQGSKPEISCGIGYNVKTSDKKTVFTVTEPKAPVYFMTRDNVKTQMYYFGDKIKADITIPAAAVKTGYEKTVPQITVGSIDGEGGYSESNIDWFKNLSYDNQKEIFKPYGGITITAKYNGGSKKTVYYTIEIISDKDEKCPVKILYSDGYTANVYCSKASSGNSIGIMELASIYRTNRYPLSRLVETITTDEKGYGQSKELPLGKYIVRELDAASGYVTDSRTYEVELKYKNQNTRLTWESIKAVNSIYSVEIDISKAFETSYASGKYVKDGGAVFGIYTAEKISTGTKIENGDSTSSVEKDTLVDTVTVGKDGHGIIKTKLPEGHYYVKELKTKEGYITDKTPYYFTAGDKQADFKPLEFDYNKEGISGKAILDSFGKAIVTIDIKARIPMPDITVDNKTYSLEKSIETKDIIISRSSDKATVKIMVCNEEERNILLPEISKVLKIKTSGNTYSYELGGTSGTYIPETVYTGYLASFEKEFIEEENKVDVLLPEIENLQFAAAGRNPSKLDINMTHIPKTYEEELSEGVVTKAVTDANGKQIYEHNAKIIVNGGEKEFLIKEGEKKEFKDYKGTSFKIGIEAGGNLKVSAYGFPEHNILPEQKPYATVNGTPLEVKFVKNVTHARSDRSEGTVRVKINSMDNVNAGDIYNDKEKSQDTPYIPGKPDVPKDDKGEFEIIKVDAETGKALTGAKFKIQSDNKEFGERYEVTDKKGRIKIKDIKEGIYYICEIEAPNGYVLDKTIHKINVTTNKTAVITIENSRLSKEDVPDKPEKDKPARDKPEKYVKRVPKTGDITGLMMYFIIFFLSLLAWVLLGMRKMWLKSKRSNL